MMRCAPPPLDWFRTEIPLQIESMEGWCSASKALALFEYVIARRPARSIELGVWGGRSLFPLACGHWATTFGHISGFDTYRVEETLEGTNDPENAAWWQTVDFARIEDEARLTLSRAVPAAYWSLIKTRTYPEPPSVGTSTDPITRTPWVDLLHQDSNHSEEVSCAELAYWRPAMRPGSLWILDDANWPSIQKVRREMRDAYGFTLLVDAEQWASYEVPAP